MQMQMQMKMQMQMHSSHNSCNNYFWWSVNTLNASIATRNTKCSKQSVSNQSSSTFPWHTICYQQYALKGSEGGGGAIKPAVQCYIRSFELTFTHSSSHLRLYNTFFSFRWCTLLSTLQLLISLFSISRWKSELDWPSTHTSPTPPLFIQTLPSFILSCISFCSFCPWHLIIGLLDTIRNHNGIPHQIYRYCYHYCHLDI